MQVSPARIVAQLLADLGVAGAVGDPTASWPVYVSQEPGAPDDVLTVYNTEPMPSDRVMGGNADQPQGHSGIQVRVRAMTEQYGWDRAERVIDALNDVYRRAVTVAGFSPVTVHALVVLPDAPTSLGSDKPKSARRLFTVNAFVVLV